jgi:hypothetical protein
VSHFTKNLKKIKDKKVGINQSTNQPSNGDLCINIKVKIVVKPSKRHVQGSFWLAKFAMMLRECTRMANLRLLSFSCLFSASLWTILEPERMFPPNNIFRIMIIHFCSQEKSTNTELRTRVAILPGQLYLWSKDCGFPRDIG